MKKLTLKQAKDKLWKAMDRAEKNKNTGDFRAWEGHLLGLEEAQKILDQIEEPKLKTVGTNEMYKRMSIGINWSIGMPAWSCPCVAKNKKVKPHGLQCVNSHILTSGFPHPYPCSKETCPMLLAKPNLGNTRYYRENWTRKGVPCDKTCDI